MSALDKGSEGTIDLATRVAEIADADIANLHRSMPMTSAF